MGKPGSSLFQESIVWMNEGGGFHHQLSPPQLSPPQLSITDGAPQLWETDGQDGAQDWWPQDWCPPPPCCGHGSGLWWFNEIGIGRGNGSGSGSGIMRSRFFCKRSAMAAAFFKAIIPSRWATFWRGPKTNISATIELIIKQIVIARILTVVV